ncbi:beta-1,6-N-acetylglucosaminyltransferase [Aureispira]|nr:beta-1,6-N-acetylglucosaminyltransferase [Aureispira sp.]
MTKAFLIMAYKDPSQIERLVKKLYHPNFDFYIHVDKTFDFAPFQYLETLPNVYFTSERYQMIWASYRLIEAMTKFMAKILQSPRNYDFISAFTGQDYPIKPTEYIYDYYCQNLGSSFLTLEDLDSPWYDRCNNRYTEYHMTYYNFRGRYIIQYLLQKTLPTRKFPTYKKIYGGPRSSWWTLSSDCAKYVLDILNTNKKLTKFAKHTWAPDEFLIPTIIMNSHFKEKVILDSGRYIDWSQGGWNPKILTIEDYNQLCASDKLYARKFDILKDTEILDKLDAI